MMEPSTNSGEGVRNFNVKDIMIHEAGAQDLLLITQDELYALNSNPIFAGELSKPIQRQFKIVIKESDEGQAVLDMMKMGEDVKYFTDVFPESKQLIDNFNVMKQNLYSVAYDVKDVVDKETFIAKDVGINRDVTKSREPTLESRVHVIDHGPPAPSGNPDVNGVIDGAQGFGGGVEGIINQAQGQTAYRRNWNNAYTQFADGFSFGSSSYRGTNATIMGYYRGHRFN